MTRQEYYEKTQEVLNNFIWNSDYIKWYNNDPIFRSCIESLTRGANPYDIIATIIKARIELEEELLKAINLNAHPPTIIYSKQSDNAEINFPEVIS